MVAEVSAASSVNRINIVLRAITERDAHITELSCFLSGSFIPDRRRLSINIDLVISSFNFSHPSFHLTLPTDLTLFLISSATRTSLKPRLGLSTTSCPRDTLKTSSSVNIQPASQSVNMDDPFPEAQAEASQALANSQQLFESYMRIKSTLSSSSSKGSSEELSYAEAELKGTLSVLHADVNDLEEAVEAAERHGPEAFGLSLATIQERRRFVLGIREAMDVSFPFLSSLLAVRLHAYRMVLDRTSGAP